MKKSILLILMFLKGAIAFSQTHVVWERTNPYIPETLVKDHENNIISVDIDYDIGGVVKYTTNGDVIWSISASTLSGGYEDFGTFYNKKVAVDDENSIYITLGHYDPVSDNNYNKVVKISSVGGIVWETQHLLNAGPNGNYIQGGLELDAQKNVYVYGVVSDPSLEYARLLLIKYNASGVFQWQKSITNNGTGSSMATCLAIDQQNNVIVGGALDVNGFSVIGSCALYKFDQDGNQIWQIKEDNVNYRPYRLLVDNQNNITVFRSGQGLARIIKYNPNGSELFNIDYGPSAQGLYAPDLTPDQNGNFFVTGGFPNANNTYSYKTSKYNSSGQLLWQQIFTPNGNPNAMNLPTDAAVDDFGNIAVVGVSYDIGHTNVKVPIIKYDADGDQIWTATPSAIVNASYYPPAVVSIGQDTYVGTPQSNVYAPGVLTKYADSYVVNFYSECAYGPKGSEVLVPINVRNFTNVVGAQFTIEWDPAVVQYVGVENFSLAGMSANSFGITQAAEGVLTFSWNDPGLQPQDLADDSPLFSIRFSLIGNYDTSTPVTITGESIPMEVIGLNAGEFAPMEIDFTACSVSIESIYFEGVVLYPNSEPVQNVTIDVSGSELQSLQTDQTGYYFFYPNSPSETASYTLTPSKPDDPQPLNGIDVQDVASIRRHILKTQLLTSPYQIIAADVNQSHTVTTFDIILVQAVILGVKDNFPNNALWTFVPSDFQFTNAALPFPYPTQKVLTPLSSPTNNFVAIKYGDVNMSRDNNQSGRREVAEVVFETGHPQEQNGIVSVPVKVYGFSDISAYQFTLTWNEENLSYIGRDNSSLQGDFGEHRTFAGQLTTLWDDSEGKSTSLQDGSTLFTLKFQRKSEGSNVHIELNGPTPASVFSASLERMNFVTRQGAETPNTFEAGIYPNPFTSNGQANIKLKLPKAGNVQVEIMTIDGKKIRTMLAQCEQGVNTLVWDGKDNTDSDVRSGLYLVKIITGTVTSVVKVVKK